MLYNLIVNFVARINKSAANYKLIFIIPTHPKVSSLPLTPSPSLRLALSPYRGRAVLWANKG